LGNSFTNANYLDVTYSTSTGANLDYSKILDSTGEFTISGPGSYTVNGAPVPVVTEVDAATGGSRTLALASRTSGGKRQIVLVDSTGAVAQDVNHADRVIVEELSASESNMDLMTRGITAVGTNRFRYFIASGGSLQRGTYTVSFTAGGIKNVDVVSGGNTVTGAENTASSASFTVEGATVLLLNPGAGGLIDVNVINGRHFLDVTFAPPLGRTLDLASIEDFDAEFILGGPGLGTVTLDGAQRPLQLSGTAATAVTYRYWITGEFAPTGAVTLTPVVGGWSFVDTAAGGTTPTATLQLTSGVLPGFMDVTLPAPEAGFSIDAASVSDLTPEFTLTTSGTANWTVTLDATRAPELQSGNTWRFFLTGTNSSTGSNSGELDFTVAFTAGAWSIYNPTTSTMGAVSADQTHSDLSYLDLRVKPSVGNSLTGGAPEVTFSGMGATTNGVLQSGTVPASLLAEIVDGVTGDVLERTYRIYLQNKFVLGGVTANIAAGQITDDAGNANVAFSGGFAVSGATADVTNPPAGQIVGTGVINSWHYLEVTFHPGSGNAINPATINGDEVVLKDSAGNVIALGVPARVAGTDTWRYGFAQNLTVGTYTVEFVAGTWADNGGISNLAASQTFRVEQATATLANPLGGTTIDRGTLNTNGYLDVTFNPVAGRQVDVDSILDGDAEFTLTGANGENVVFSGTPTRIGTTNTFRYTITTGTFDSGTLQVHFIAGSWQDMSTLAGDTTYNGGAAGTEAVRLISQSPRFFIELSGGMELNTAGLLDEPLFKVTGKVTFEAEMTTDRKVLTLDLSGQLSLIKLGTVGATAGHFVLDLTDGLLNKPQLWGVLTLQTNFSVLEPYGLFLYASGTLQVNTTDYAKTETLTLPGLGSGGTNLTRTYNLAPNTFSLELVGQALVKIPGTDSELFRLNGGFFIKLSPEKFEMFATAELSFGIGSARVTYAEARGLLVVVFQPTEGVIGVAGTFSIGASAGLGLPNIGNVFEVSGSVSVMFNTTLAKQTFEMPDSFLPLLRDGEPRSLTIFAATPNLDGTENAAASPTPFIVATVQAELRIQGFITLTGFLQISADVSGVKVTGAVGGDMPFLGALSGTVNFNAYTDDPLPTGDPNRQPGVPGVVGRIALTFRANRIPGLALEGDLLIDLNTYGSERSVLTFQVDSTTGTFVRTGNTINVVTVAVPSGVRVQLGGKFILGGFLELNGKFVFSYDGANSRLQVGATATLSLPVFGTIAMSGDLIIDGAGLLTRIDFALDSSFGSSLNLGFSASLTAHLELNTATGARTYVSLADGQTYTVDSGFHLRTNGAFSLWFASATGAVDIRINSGGIRIQFDVSLNIGGGLTLEAHGLAAVYTGANPGMVLSVGVSLDFEPVGNAVFEIHASGLLKLNTTGITRDGIAPGFVLALNGRVELLAVLKFNSGFNLVVNGTGHWRVDFNAGIDFFGIATINGYGYFDSNGNFDVTLNGRLVLGSDDWGIRLSASIRVLSEYNSSTGTYRLFLSVGGQAEVRAFGFTFAGINIGVTFEARSGQGAVEVRLSVHVSVEIDFGLFSIEIGGTVAFTIGTLELPQPSYLGGSTTPGIRFNPGATVNGPLVLLMGGRANERNFSTAITNEGFVVDVLAAEGLVGTEQSYYVRVTGLGRSREFHNVTRIVADAGDGDDSITVRGGAIPVNLSVGPGNDTLVYDGTGNVVINGGDGNDIITVRTSGTATLNGDAGNDQITFNGTGTGTLNGGDGDDVLFGSSGNNTINGGNGNDDIYGNGGVDIIDGGNGDDRIFLTFAGLGSTVTAGNGSDELTLTATGGNDNVTFDVFNSGLRIDAGAPGIITTTGLETLKFDAGVGRDTLTFRDLKGSGLVNANINLGLASPGDGSADTISFDGTSGADTFTGSIARSGGVVSGLQLVETGGATYVIQNAVRSEGDTLIINGLGGDDVLTFAAIVTTDPDLIAMRLFGGDGNDTLVGTPFADYLDGGAGNDTFTGREGFDTFVDSGGANTLIETFDSDMGLFGNRFVVGKILNDAGGTTLNADPFWPAGNPTNPAAPAPTFSRLRDAGDQWQAGATVEDTGGIFTTAILTGGNGVNVMVVGDRDGVITVAGSLLDVTPWMGTVTLNNGNAPAGSYEYYILNTTGSKGSHFIIADTGATGIDELIVNSNDQPDTLVLNATGSGALRQGTITVLTGPSETETVTFTGVDAVVVSTFGANDTVTVSDTAAPTLIDLGAGDDTVTLGSVPLIPDTGNTNAEYPGGLPVGDKPSITNGNSDPLVLFGGTNNDTFNINHNVAPLFVDAGAGNDFINLATIIVLRASPGSSGFTQPLGASGARYDYVDNGPMVFTGGPGIDRLTLVGTPAGDSLLLTDTLLAGAGRSTALAAIEVVSIDGSGGPDEIYTLATGAFDTKIYGGGGTDTIHVGGAPPALSFPSFTVTVPASFDAGRILNRLTIDAGTQTTGERDQLIIHNDAGSSAPSLLTHRTLPRTEQVGEDQAGNLLFQQAVSAGVGLTDTFQSFEGAGVVSGTAYDTGFYYGFQLLGLERLEILLATGNDDLTVTETETDELVYIYGGPGNDVINLRTLQGETHVLAGAGNDTINVGSLTPAIGGNVNQILGALFISGEAGTDATNVDDRSDTFGNTGYLTATQLTGLGMAVGITYDTLEVLNIDTGSGDDVFNIRGTSAVTNISLHDGDDQIYVSSLANVAGGDPRPDFLSGNLDSIQGPLNINAGAGRHLLFVSDASATRGDSAVTIANGLIRGLSPADITYVADNPSGNFADGITIWAGSGNDNISVVGTNERPGLRTITTLNTGAGDDNVVVALNAAVDGFFVLNTQDGNDTVDGSDSTLSLVIFGGLGNDAITGGNRRDIIFGDQGRVEYNSGGQVVTLLGNGGPGDKTDGVVRAPTSIYTVSSNLGGGDALNGGPGEDILFGGAGADNLSGGLGDDIVFGDHGHLLFAYAVVAPAWFGGRGGANRTVQTAPNAKPLATDANLFAPAAFSLVETTDPTLGGDDILFGGDGNDVIIGGTGNDTIDGGNGNDLIFGDHGRVDYSLPVNRNFASIFTQATDGGGNDIIYGGTGDDIIMGQQGNDLLFGDSGDDDIWGGHNVFGGSDGSDIIDGGAGNDVILGDNGVIARRGDSITTRAQSLTGTTVFDALGNTPLTNQPEALPTGAVARTIRIWNDPNAQGDDIIAGGAGDDMIFGEQGNDTIRGDGYIDPALSGLASLKKSIDNSTDGDDYIEGNGGDDTIYGDLGQDDIIGGSSDMFGLTIAALRADGADTIYGGDGTDTVRNTPGDTSPNGHARDADVILGDNGDIIRLVGTNGGNSGHFLTFNYDNSPGATLHIIPRAYITLDYTPGTGSPNDNGGADVIHGEAGNDLIHGETSNDVIYGEGQDDSIIAGAGDDWVSGGTGDDAVLVDDGWITPSRNGLAEPLYGIAASVQQTISAGTSATATIFVTGRMNFSVHLIQPDQGGRDIIYGGLGNDFLHGGAGSDGISGAEALPEFYNTPSLSAYRLFTPGVLVYDPYNPLAKINGHPLNFDATDGGGQIIHDGEDALFGEGGDDWLVGGTDVDHMYGGAGNDVINADDNLDTNGGANISYDAAPFNNADIVFGDAGQDTVLANSSGDRLFDLAGEFNGYLTPSSPFGVPGTAAFEFSPAGPFLRTLMLSEGSDPALTGLTASGTSTTGRAFWQIGPGA
jgi:Ca2+-binding RTX toxin-like protein